MDRAEATLDLYGGSRYPHDPSPARQRVIAGKAWDRCGAGTGLPRHWAAVKASRDRTHALRTVQVPTLVIHGDEDPAIGVSGGEATAQAVPGARLLIIPGMGHQLPSAAWETMIDAIVSNISRCGDQTEALIPAVIDCRSGDR